MLLEFNLLSPRFQRIKQQAMWDLKFIQNWSDPIKLLHNRNYCIIASCNWAEDKVTSSPQKMEMEANCLGHESLKVAILSTQNHHVDIMQF